MQSKICVRSAASLIIGAVSLALIAVPAQARQVERGVEPAHQPKVERTDFVFDVATGNEGAIDAEQGRRLTAWFNALGLRYGDRVSLSGPAGFGLAGVRDGVREIVARYGLLIANEAPLTAGEPPVGALRVIVSRSMASVDGCPSWRDRSNADLTGGLSDNYGCAMASNLAAMVADPQDLVQGRAADTDLRTATSSRAIRSYQEKAPTGSGGLQVMSAGGK